MGEISQICFTTISTLIIADLYLIEKEFGWTRSSHGKGSTESETIDPPIETVQIQCSAVQKTIYQIVDPDFQIVQRNALYKISK